MCVCVEGSQGLPERYQSRLSRSENGHTRPTWGNDLWGTSTFKETAERGSGGVRAVGQNSWVWLPDRQHLLLHVLDLHAGRADAGAQKGLRWVLGDVIPPCLTAPKHAEARDRVISHKEKRRETNKPTNLIFNKRVC